MSGRFIVTLGLAVSATATGPSAGVQLPISVAKATGQTVTPAFEGWYRNPDGSFSVSFGYLNRNAEEVVSVPIGAENHVEPGPTNQGQPTEFQPGRHWGVFAVKVPADFGSKEVTWTIAFRGAMYAIPGNLRPNCRSTRSTAKPDPATRRPRSSSTRTVPKAADRSALFPILCRRRLGRP